MAKVWYRRDRKRWVCDYEDATGQRRRVLLKRGSTKDDADARLADLVKETGEACSNGPLKLPPDTTLAEYADRWLASRTELHPRTLASYRQLLTSYILPAFGAEPVRLLNRGRVKRFLGERARTEANPTGLGKNSVRLIRACLSVLCEDAIDEGLLTVNPTRQRSSRRKQPGQLTRQERTKSVRAMDTAQLARFLAAAREHEPRCAPLLLTMARAGLRPGEALALQWEDLDLAAGTLRIHRAMSLGKEGPTKTGEEREVHLSPELVASLTRLRAERERETLRRGWPALPPWVFCSVAGTAYDPANVVKAMKRALRKAELPGFRLYDLRHTFATLLLNRGVPITYVAAQLGHAKPTTTLQWYAHHLPKATAHYVDLLDGAVTGGASDSLAPLAPTSGTTPVSEAPASLVSVEILEDLVSGPARNRTANPLIIIRARSRTPPPSSSVPPPAISEDYES